MRIDNDFKRRRAALATKFACYMWEGYRRHTGPEFIAARGAVELSSRCDILLLAHEGRASLMSE